MNELKAIFTLGVFLLVSLSSHAESAFSDSSALIGEALAPVDEAIRQFANEELGLGVFEIDNDDELELIEEADDVELCLESDGVKQTKLRQRFIDKLSEEYEILKKYSDQYHKKALRIFEEAEKAPTKGLPNADIWKRGKFYWDWSGEFSKMAEKRKREIRKQWFEIAEDFENAGDEYKQAGENEKAEDCYARAVAQVSPYHVKPWLIPLLNKNQGSSLLDRATHHARTIKILEKAAKAARDGGSEKRAKKYERRIKEHAESGADDFENSADHFEDVVGIPEIADELRDRAAALRKKAK
jgi:tetratricopeptide (TPR) repeat protein